VFATVLLIADMITTRNTEQNQWKKSLVSTRFLVYRHRYQVGIRLKLS